MFLQQMVIRLCSSQLWQCVVL